MAEVLNNEPNNGSEKNKKMQPEDSREAAKEESKPLVDDKDDSNNQEAYSDSYPGTAAAAAATTSQASTVDNADATSQMSAGMKRQPKALEVCLYLRDQTVIHVLLDDGHLAQADDLFEIVKEEQQLPSNANSIFSLWLVSPLLELRLKKTHRPYYLVQQWHDLCLRHTDARMDIQKDNPMLMFQRNVFYSKEEEMHLQDESMLSLLYHEARYNVLEGRYVLDRQYYDRLAAIQFIIEYGADSKNKNPVQICRNHPERYYPDFLCKKRWQIPGLRNSSRPVLECRFEQEFQQVTEEFRDQESNKIFLYKKYLEILWSYPFYGSAFFSAMVDRPSSRLQMLLGSQPVQVWVCINTEGLCIIEKDKDFVDLAVPFTEMSWQLHDNDIDEDKLPSLFIQFLVKDEGENVTKLLEIHSKQAKLMNALIDSMVKRKRMEQPYHRHSLPNFDSVDGGISVTFSKNLNKLKRLSLDTYTTTDMLGN